MARPRKPTPVIPSKSMVAAATRFAATRTREHRPTMSWQQECYRHYSICGEARFAAQFFGHALSRARLTVSSPGDGGLQVQDGGPAVEGLMTLFNGPNGQAQMLNAVGTHLTISGECYLVGRSAQENEAVVGAPETAANDHDIWEIISPLEMTVTGGIWKIRYEESRPDIELTEDDVVIRIWNPHPARRME